VRSLRVLLAANDGFSAGHVARVVAVARGLHRVASKMAIAVEALLLTTSEASALYDDPSIAVVRLPSPKNAQRAKMPDAERRRLVRALVDSAAESFAPDLLVIDTFPKGPHGELEGLLRSPAKRALLRRDVRADRAQDDVLHAGIERFDVVVLADDPAAIEKPQGARNCVRVPPITMYEPEDALSRAAARSELGIPNDARAILVAAGGGGDAGGNETARAIAERVAKLEPGAHVVLAEGPLRERSAAALPPSVRAVSVTPLSRYLAAFDCAFSAAGYNSAHELAKARVPTALFAESRPFDDQRARAERFERAGLAHVLDSADGETIPRALAWKPPSNAEAVGMQGADSAAEALIALVAGGGE